jgi:ssRNA-specific RNase YbeY (16S rRNA maturation enzyme)
MHGMLHLLGYDHVDVPEEVAEEMRAREDELQAALGKSWRKPWILGH